VRTTESAETLSVLTALCVARFAMQQAAVIKRATMQAMQPLLAPSASSESDKSYFTGDLSMELGKDPRKMPKVARFANPPIDIKASVMRMRSLTRCRQAFRIRSWEAAFSFTKKSFKVPQFERFAHPVGDINAAVQEMRLAALAKRASKQRSWAAAFTFTKRTLKKPQFERFAQPSSDIRIAVEEMRQVAMAQRARKQRSWAASFDFKRKTSKLPMFDRFDRTEVQVKIHIDVFQEDNPGFFSLDFEAKPDDISFAVEEMRQAAAAKRANKRRSWAAEISSTQRFGKIPKFDRFLRPSTDIGFAVQEMRLSTATKGVNKARSWTDGLWFTKQTVQDMREREMWRWIQEGGVVEKVNHQEEVLIEDSSEELDVSTCVPTPASDDRTLKMLIAPSSEMDVMRDRLQYLLQSMQREVSNSDDRIVKAISLRLLLPEPSNGPETHSPPEPVTGTFSLIGCDAQLSQYFESDLEQLDNKVVREGCVRCERLLRNFRVEAEVFESQQEEDAREVERLMQADEVEQLIQEEQLRNVNEQEQEKINVEQLIDEELVHSTGSVKKIKTIQNAFKPGSLADRLTNPSYAPKSLSSDDAELSSREELPPTVKSVFMAGSPAAAVRQLRSNHSTFRMDKDDKPTGLIRESSITRAYNALGVELHSLDDGEDTNWGHPKASARGIGARSALAMDLDCNFASSSPFQPQKAQHSLAKSSSLGALKITKSDRPAGALQPLVMSKSSALLPGFSATKGLSKKIGDSHGWSIGERAFQPYADHGKDPFAWSAHATRTRCSSVGAVR